MRNTSCVRLVVVDAQSIFRAGIRQICSAFPEIVVAGEAGRCADALALCDRLRPELLLVDATLPGMLSMVAQLRQLQPGVGVVVLADELEEAVLRRALQLGVAGFLLKQIDGFDLVQAIRGAAGGLLTLAPEATAALAARDEPRPEELSVREQAVLALLLQGYSNDDMADRLQVSRSTVKFHLRNIYLKLGVRSRVEALALVYGQRRGARSGEAPSELPRRRSLAAVV
jgi:NarL family two-component system response regulator LiaR